MSDYILVPRVKTLPPEYVAFGSQVVACDGCGSDCWIAPSSILVMRSKPILAKRKLCHPCAEKFTVFCIDQILERAPADQRARLKDELYEKLRERKQKGPAHD